jgi:hypothetical protein
VRVETEFDVDLLNGAATVLSEFSTTVLSEFSIENFKAFGAKQSVPLAPITLIYGPNSGGKSSLIQSLLLMKQSFVETDFGEVLSLVPRGGYVDLGSHQAMIHKHEENRSVRFAYKFKSRGKDQFRAFPFGLMIQSAAYGLDFSCARNPSLAERLFKRLAPRAGQPEPTPRAVQLELSNLQYSLDFQSLPAPVKIHLQRSSVENQRSEVAFGIDRAMFEFSDLGSAENWSKLSQIERRARAENSEHPLNDRLRSSSAKSGLFQPEEEVDEHPKDVLKNIRFMTGRRGIPEFPSDSSGLLRIQRGPEWMMMSSHQLKEFFDALTYLGPLRAPPERFYLASGSELASVGKSGAQSAQLLFRNQSQIKPELDYWFKELGVPYEIEVVPLSDSSAGELFLVSLIDKRTRVRVSPADVGFGISQMLPILVEGLIQDGRTICVEQPELHLHPRLQASLADFFIETATSSKDSKRRSRRRLPSQWIIETHSEALMLRIQRRIREGHCSSDDVSVLYVQPGEQGSKVHQLRLDQEGEFIDEWPDGFFEDDFHELWSGRVK